MTTKKKAATGKRNVKGLKLKKETLKDLGVKGKARGVKGGYLVAGPVSLKITCGGNTCGLTADIRCFQN